MEKGVPFSGERGKRAGGVALGARSGGGRGGGALHPHYRQSRLRAAASLRGSHRTRPRDAAATGSSGTYVARFAHSALLLLPPCRLVRCKHSPRSAGGRSCERARARGAVPFAATRVGNAEEYLTRGRPSCRVRQSTVIVTVRDRNAIESAQCIILSRTVQ